MSRLIFLLVIVLLCSRAFSQGFQINQGSSTTKCNNDSLVLTATTGPSYSNYQWFISSNPGNILGTDTLLVLFTIPGTGEFYTVQADSAGITLSYEIFIIPIPSPNVNLGMDTIFCSGDTLILKDSILTGGAYGYLWNTGATTETIQITSPGTYWLRLTGPFPNPCRNRDTIVVSKSPKLQLQDQGTFNICQGESLAVSVLFDSVGIAPYQVTWSPSSLVSNPNTLNTILTSAVDTNVEIFVRDRNGIGCSDSVTIPVKIRPQVQAQLAFTDSLICIGDNIVLSASGTSGTPASGGYNFLWTGNNISGANTNSPTANPNTLTQYEVFVSDSFNCDDSAIVTISLDTFQISIANGDSAFICSGESAQILVDVIGGDGNETFAWSPDNGGISDVNIPEPLISIQGTYTLTGTSSNNCLSSDIVSIGVSDLPVFNFSALDPFYCESSGIVNLSGIASLGFGPYKYVYSHRDSILNIDSTDAVTFPANQLGSDGSEVVIGYVIDSKACVSAIDTAIVEIKGGGLLSLRLNNNPFVDDSVSFTLTGATTADSVFWNFGNGITVTASETSKNVFDSLGFYLIEATAYFQGCDGTDTLTIEIIAEIEANTTYIPTAFSKNARNPENQTLKFYGNNVIPEQFVFQVYSAWGEQIFESTDLNEMTTLGWDAEKLESGVYVVNCKGTFRNGEPFSIQQSVNKLK